MNIENAPETRMTVLRDVFTNLAIQKPICPYLYLTVAPDEASRRKRWRNFYLLSFMHSSSVDSANSFPFRIGTDLVGSD